MFLVRPFSAHYQPRAILFVVVAASLFFAHGASAQGLFVPSSQVPLGSLAPGVAVVTNYATGSIPPTGGVSIASASAASPLQAWAEQAFAAAAVQEQHGQDACVDTYYQCASYSCQALQQGLHRAQQDPGLVRVWSLYHMSLAKVMQLGQLFGRLDARRGLTVNTPGGAVLIPFTYQGFPWSPADFQQIVVVGEYHSPSPKQIYRRPGLGVPLIVIRERGYAGDFVSNGQPFAATAVLRLSPVSPAGGAVGSSPSGPSCLQGVLELHDPYRVKSVPFGGLNLAMAADVTAPLAYAWMTVKRDPIRSALEPGTHKTEAKLSFIEPYQRGRIPVIFVHGLLSDPFTWVDLANELRMREQILNRYQIWAYQYPTGKPFLGPAADLRAELMRAFMTLDPQGTDPALRHIVLVGHSMGGLVSKLQVTHSGNHLWSQAANRPLQHINANAEDKAQIARTFFFEPQPNVRRVVFIGTPHSGSSLAKLAIGRLGSSWIKMPNDIDRRYRNLLAQNPGVFASFMRYRLPTSIDMLEPENPILIAIRNLPVSPHVQLHSIIGHGHNVPFAGDGDGYVPVTSAWHPGVATEQFVKARHTELHHHPETINGLLQILAVHTAQYDAQWAATAVAPSQATP